MKENHVIVRYIETCVIREESLKKWKREKAKITGRKLLDELENGNQAKFWDKLKRGCPEVALSASCSSRIGQVSKVPEILELWRAHFGSLGNSQEECVYKKHRDEYLRSMKEYIEVKGGEVWKIRVSLSEVEKAIGALSLKKAVVTDGVSAEHIRFGGGALSLHLSTLFQAMLRHSFVPKEYKESVVVPIVKDRNKDISDPNNYRGIAVTYVVSKIFERLILSKWEVLLQSSEFQFGFKKGIECAECSHVVQEAIDYYLSNGTNSMLACALDLSKAYDRVSHYGLFCKLIKRGIPVAVVKLIEGWYTDQTLRVKWGGQLSEPVHVSNGIRQGGVFSPSLFN